MRGSIFGKQTESFGGNALALLLWDNHDAHFGPLVQRLVVLQIDETDAAAIGRLDDEAKLTVAEDVVAALGNVLLQGEMGERNRSLAQRPQRGVVLYEVHQVEVLRLNCPQSQSLTL